MKRINLETLEKDAHLSSYAQLCEYIYHEIETGHLKPVKARGTNGKKPALYREYHLLEPGSGQDPYRLYEEELNYQMSTKISTDYYLRHLDQYKKDRAWVLKLNAYLLAQKDSAPTPTISKNERSFQIWGREKFLQAEQGKKILNRCGVAPSQLSFYETSEPLAYYSSHRRIPQNLLILENKDTFYSIRRHLMEYGETVFGTPFGTLIYGAGKGILRSYQDFSFCVEPYMRAQENQLYYFGDLDYEGIGIYERLAERFARNRLIPFVAAYERMIQKSRVYSELPETKAGQNRSIGGYFFSFFSERTVREMTKILESGRYIPQEILNIGDFQTEAG